MLDQLAPSPVWAKLRTDGVAIPGELRFGPKQLPADWVSLKSPPGPAAGFAEFGYNALRIPLYLVRGGVTDRDLLTRLMRGTSGANGEYTTIDTDSGSAKDNLSDPGYQIINHILACVINKTAVPEDLKRPAPTRYYPSSTLHLAGAIFIAAQQPGVLMKSTFIALSAAVIAISVVGMNKPDYIAACDAIAFADGCGRACYADAPPGSAVRHRASVA